MPSKPEHLYEYAVIRYLPCVEREEFINVGLIMMCKRQRWIRCEVLLNEARISAFHSQIPIEDLRHQLEAFTLIAAGDRKTGDIARLPVEERFRWLTAVRSACIQTSRPHPGLTSDLQATFLRLFAELVE